MRQLLVGDCHFGINSNSVVWLENQLLFFNTKFCEVLDNKEIDRVVFLGDLFDIRYSVNQQVGIELKKLFRKLLKKYSQIEFYCLAGNHDYYSPLEEFHEYNSYELVFGDEFENSYDNFKIINNEPYYDHKGNLYLPWYYTENFQNFSNILYSIDEDIKNIFCHDDLSKWDYSRCIALKKAQVWAGHIHNPLEIENKNLHNIESIFAFNFSDVNTNKYLYILEDFEIVDKIENDVTPKFKRFFNEAIFELNENDFKNSYVQLCIYNTNINKAKYIERIKEIKNNYVDFNNIRIKIIDNTFGETLEVNNFNTNIDKYIEDNIPDYLNPKYNFVRDKIKNQEVNV